MESYSIHFNISTAIFFIIQLIILGACIVIAQKKKSIATKLLLTGAILNILTNATRLFINKIAILSGQDDMMLMHVAISYASNIAYVVFAVGLLQFALNDLTEENNNRRDDNFRRL